MSHDYVGDLAETVALIWPQPEVPPAAPEDPALSVIVVRLQSLTRQQAPFVMAELLDRLEANGRFALLKLATGGLRVGVSARRAKHALAQAFGLDVGAVEEVWHGIPPPYQPPFHWAVGRAAQPTQQEDCG